MTCDLNRWDDMKPHSHYHVTCNRMEDITKEVSQKVENDLPLGSTLYIATDLGQAQRPKLLGHIFPKYRVFFLDDFRDELELLASQIPSPAGYLVKQYRHDLS